MACKPKYCTVWIVILSQVIAGCAQESRLVAVPNLVTLVPDAAINSWPLGVTEGAVIVEGGCAKVDRVGAQAPDAALVFPPSFKLREIEQGWAIVNRRGDIWGTVGETKRIGGAELHPEVASRFVTTADRERCPGAFWLVLPDDPLDLMPRNQPAPPPPTTPLPAESGVKSN